MNLSSITLTSEKHYNTYYSTYSCVVCVDGQFDVTIFKPLIYSRVYAYVWTSAADDDEFRKSLIFTNMVDVNNWPKICSHLRKSFYNLSVD